MVTIIISKWAVYVFLGFLALVAIESWLSLYVRYLQWKLKKMIDKKK